MNRLQIQLGFVLILLALGALAKSFFLGRRASAVMMAASH